MAPFRKLHVEDMFSMGREGLSDVGQFWNDWMAILKTKPGDVVSRLLKEALLYTEGVDGLVKAADENGRLHPSLYLEAMRVCRANHAYEKLEQIGERAVERLDEKLRIRSEIALLAAGTASDLRHKETTMRLCWEAFRSDSTVRNYLRLFGAEEMASLYGMRGREVLDVLEMQKQRTAGAERRVGISMEYGEYVTFIKELQCNELNEYQYHELQFYVGDFKAAKKASKNPKGSLGWSGSFICYGIRMFLLYLYEAPILSEAAADAAGYIGFGTGRLDVEKAEEELALDFERELEAEVGRQAAQGRKTSLFWLYFQKWKKHFPMSEKEKAAYFSWAEQIVYSRADAIVGGQHRNQYGEVAALLAMAAEIKETMGQSGSRGEIYLEYRKKFPRHSSFQAEMRRYFCL